MNASSAPVALLLAAGRGERFDPSGTQLKLLSPAPSGPRAGLPLALAAARGLLAVVPVVVAVVRPAHTPAQQQLHLLLQEAGCRLVVSEDADDGIGGSIAAGVRATQEATGWLVALADMPAVATTTLAAVVQRLAAGAISAAPVHGGQRGHPVGFAAALRAELAALRGDEGARSVLARHPPDLVAVDDAGCLLDIDRRQDLAPPA